MTVITLTPDQLASITSAIRRAVPEVTVPLTREQYKKIKKAFPEIGGMNLTVGLSAPVGNVAPFIPGGAVVSATIASAGRTGATATLDTSSGD